MSVDRDRRLAFADRPTVPFIPLLPIPGRAVTPNPIRVVALGVVYRDGEVLAARHRDPEMSDPFYRPIGGGVEFGEHSREPVVREFAEELDATFLDPS